MVKPARDMRGYGEHPPHARSGNARIAVQFVLNYEEAVRTACCTATSTRKPSSDIIGAAPIVTGT